MNKSNYEGTIGVTLGGTVTVNTLAVIGGFVGMYMKGGESGDIVPFLIQGKIASATKVGSQAWAVGDAVYWDADNSRFTKVAQGSSPDGVAASIVASGASDTTGDVILLGNSSGAVEDFGANGIKTDVVAESTSATGVTVDGVLLKDNDVKADSLEAETAATGLNVFESGGKGGFFATTPVTQPTHVADPAAMDAITTTPVVLTNMEDGSANNTLEAVTDTSMSDQSGPIERNFDKIGDEINALGVDVAAAKTAIDANNAAIDSILSQLATLGLQAAS